LFVRITLENYAFSSRALIYRHFSTDMASCTASDKVFSTPELLNMIIKSMIPEPEPRHVFMRYKRWSLANLLCINHYWFGVAVAHVWRECGFSRSWKTPQLEDLAGLIEDPVRFQLYASQVRLLSVISPHASTIVNTLASVDRKKFIPILRFVLSQAQFPNLKFLHFSGPDFTLWSRAVLYSTLRRVDILTLSIDDALQLLKDHCSLLEEVRIISVSSDLSGAAQRDIASFLEAEPNLKYFDVPHAPLRSRDSILAMARLPNLEYININISRLEREWIDAVKDCIRQPFPKLQSAYLEGSINQLTGLAPYLSKTKELCLKINQTETSLTHIIYTFPHLTKLKMKYIDSASFIGEYLNQMLPSCPRLQGLKLVDLGLDLGLGSKDPLKNETLLKFVHHLVNLKQLKISQATTDLDEKALETISRHCSSLTSCELDMDVTNLSNCQHLQTMPNLRTLVIHEYMNDDPLHLIRSLSNQKMKDLMQQKFPAIEFCHFTGVDEEVWWDTELQEFDAPSNIEEDDLYESLVFRDFYSPEVPDELWGEVDELGGEADELGDEEDDELGDEDDELGGEDDELED
jgi:hypothetical protein